MRKLMAFLILFGATSLVLSQARYDKNFNLFVASGPTPVETLTSTPTPTPTGSPTYTATFTWTGTIQAPSPSWTATSTFTATPVYKTVQQSLWSATPTPLNTPKPGYYSDLVVIGAANEGVSNGLFRITINNDIVVKASIAPGNSWPYSSPMTFLDADMNTTWGIIPPSNAGVTTDVNYYILRRYKR